MIESFSRIGDYVYEFHFKAKPIKVFLPHLKIRY